MRKHRKIFLVDPNVSTAVRVQRLLAEQGYSLVRRFASAPEAYRGCQTSPPELAIVRLSEAGESEQTRLARRFGKYGVGVIFVSGHDDELTYQAARSEHTLAYLIAPVSPFTLAATLELAERYRQLHRTDDEEITTDPSVGLLARQRGGTHLIHYKEILFLRANGHSCDIYTDRGRYLIDQTITALERLLPPDRFFRCHRQFIVRLDRVNTLHRTERTLRVGDHTIPFSRRKAKETSELYFRHQ